jgi:uncharacterized protein YdeI (YjbR/CyaY-like superfamily)
MENEKKTWNKSKLWAQELEVLKSIINATGLVETTKWGGPVYTLNGKNVLGIGGFKNYFSIWFYKGVFLKDEAGVLVNANEENTKSLRQWRFESVKDINEELILAYVNEAIAVEQVGLGIKPQGREIPVPGVLQQELDANTGLKVAFEAFTPFKQKEFNEYITEAKQEKTKLARLEKIRPMILDGRGLNDRYR